jgi:hypothetical protein
MLGMLKINEPELKDRKKRFMDRAAFVRRQS